MWRATCGLRTQVRGTRQRRRSSGWKQRSAGIEFRQLKRLEWDPRRQGFTAMVLALGAILGQPGEADVRQALEAVAQEGCPSWLRQNLGLSTHVCVPTLRRKKT